MFNISVLGSMYLDKKDIYTTQKEGGVTRINPNKYLCGKHLLVGSSNANDSPV